MPSRWIGIDFSGDHLQWRPGRQTSNVWIADLVETPAGLHLEQLRRVQSLPGEGAPFHRLSHYLAAGNFAAAAIDAPFSLPAQFMPASGFTGLLELVDQMPLDTRPFPKAIHLVAAVAHEHLPRGLKAYRHTEEVWRSRGINVRSTLWAGPRGGAAFTLACLRLLRLAGQGVWPWHTTSKPVIAEAFPAAQLLQWNLPYQKYNGSKDGAPEIRQQIIQGLKQRVPELDLGGHEHTIAGDADALDALLCAFSAKAVTKAELASMVGEAADLEGWIAVHR